MCYLLERGEQELSILRPLGIPALEYRDRLAGLRKAMNESKLDMMILFGDEHRQGDVRYVSGYRPMLEFSAVVIPESNDPILLCGPECLTLAQQTSVIEDVRICADLQIPGEEYPNIDMVSFRSIMASLNKKSKIARLGIPHLALVSSFLRESLGRALDDVEIIDAKAALDQLRAVKSPNELAIMRRNYEIANAAMLAGVQYATPGLRETDVAAEMAAYMWRRGPEQVSHVMMVASGLKTQAALSFPSDKKKLCEGELVILGLGVVYEGYFSDHSTTVFLGDPPPEIARAMRVCWEAKEAAIEAVRPGVEGHVVDRVARDIVEKAGFGPNCSYGVGHGVGLQHVEYPMLGPTTPVELRPGMVFAIDVGLWDLPYGGIRFEDGILVTETGVERLTVAGPPKLCKGI